MNWRCLLGHKWEKYMGAQNLGSGKFEQKYICIRCKKIKSKVS